MTMRGKTITKKNENMVPRAAADYSRQQIIHVANIRLYYSITLILTAYILEIHEKSDNDNNKTTMTGLRDDEELRKRSSSSKNGIDETDFYKTSTRRVANVKCILF